MSFHKKVLIGYVLFNVFYITLSLLNLDAPYRAAATDQDMVAYGAAKYVGPAMYLVSSGIVVVLLYAIRGLLKLMQWLRERMA